MTNLLQTRFDLPKSAIVLTQLSAAEQVVVLDSKDDRIYVVDVERGRSQLIRGALPPRWTSFCDFLEDYFLAGI